MKYSVQLTRTAAKELKKLDPQIARKVQEALLQLEEDPRRPQTKKLHDANGLYGYRVGLGVRIIYRIQDKILTVDVVRLGSHEGIYENLTRL
ncbi:type II toxin-antitoxin system RelE/ParE family toxin [Streptomyces sp. NPDC000927]|uniref:type II toxin-antitoxin system RelE family toxin n=1 Tax=Streptomyces sp. NPDC000927 TaxID=3154371 RepID=UPI00331BB922